jgi:formate dehydrogenase major subunit
LAPPGTSPGREGQQQSAAKDGASASPKTLEELIAAVNWKTDLSGGIQRVAIAHGLSPYGNGKARTVVWNYPDPVPKHREPLYTPRRD